MLKFQIPKKQSNILKFLFILNRKSKIVIRKSGYLIFNVTIEIIASKMPTIQKRVTILLS